MKWKHWKTGYYFFVLRNTTIPVLYINNKSGWRACTQQRCTKIKDKATVIRHPLFKQLNKFAVMYMPSLPVAIPVSEHKPKISFDGIRVEVNY